ncbi:MAG: glycoside hydrolase family 2 TIM barrel-domain containing protein [Chloroflexota bacterium]
MLKRQSSQRINHWQFQFENSLQEEVTVPHSWNAFDAMRLDDSWYRRGVGVYETALTFTEPVEERTFIRFGAASQKAVVSWDGVEIGRNEGGYLPFTVEVPPASKGNLRVEVDNSPDIHLPPSDRSDFFLYGGLTRPVMFYTTGSHRIERLKIDSSLNGGSGRLGLTVFVDGEISGLTVKLIVLDPAGEEVLMHTASLSQNETALDLPDVQNPALWSPDAPNLYRIQLVLKADGIVSDEVETHFGWRTFEFPAGGPFYLNGERLLLRGTHRHEDWAGCASGVNEADTREEFELMKAAGMNFIRLGHYPQADFVHSLCDELGIIVWDEIPWCRGGVGDELFKDRTRQMLRTMIAEHRHHPSIIFWGMGNELDWEYDHPQNTDDDVFEFLSELHDLSHKLDPSRLTALRRYERGAQVVDAYSPSIWSGWYRGRYQDYELALTDAQEKFPRMLHMEWSADNHVGRHNIGPHLPVELERVRDHSEQDGLAYSKEGFARASRDGDWSESYFLDLAAWTLRVQKDQPKLAGAAQWAFKDFGTPLRPENPIPNVNQKGIIDRAGRPKTAFYLFQAAQTDTQVCHIESHSWPVRISPSTVSGQVPANERQRVRVISNCESVELFLNGESQGSRTDGWLREWHLGLPEGINQFRAVGTTAEGQIIEDELIQEFVIGGNKEATQWLVQLESADGITRVTVQMADEDDRPVVGPEQRVTFELEGAGELLIDFGTIDGTQTLETANGRATARILGAGGSTALQVQSDNLPLARIEICDGNRQLDKSKG